MNDLYQCRNYIFTDYKLLNWEQIFKDNPERIRFVAWGEEICPKTKRKHNQGWLQLITKKTIKGVQKLVGSPGMHMDPRRGSPERNEEYCSKEGKYTKLGTFVTQGERTDLQEQYNAIMSGEKRDRDVAEENFGLYCRYRNGFKDAQQWSDEKNASKFRHITVIVHSGETGTGKTRIAMESSDDVFKIEGGELKWFDGYTGQKTLVIDDYSNDEKITKLLNLLDGYKLRIPIKGGFTYAQWTTIYITTNLTRDEFHPFAKTAHRAALDRRITTWKNFSGFFAKALQG